MNEKGIASEIRIRLAVPLGCAGHTATSLGGPILVRPAVRATPPWVFLQPHAGSIGSIGVSIRLQSGTSHETTETFPT